jgi:hypothetical protein
MKKLTGTTASTQGGEIAIAHGLTGSKIISFTMKIEYDTNSGMPSDHTVLSGYQASCWYSLTYISVKNSASNSVNILSKPVVITIFYEE